MKTHDTQIYGFFTISMIIVLSTFFEKISWQIGATSCFAVVLFYLIGVNFSDQFFDRDNGRSIYPKFNDMHRAYFLGGMLLATFLLFLISVAITSSSLVDKKIRLSAKESCFLLIPSCLVIFLLAITSIIEWRRKRIKLLTKADLAKKMEEILDPRYK
jgi:hypothetical protein